MNKNSTKTYNLKTLFELRKTKSTHDRTGCARVFYCKDKLGLSDASCLLWPVFLAPEYKNPDLKSGDIIKFTSKFTYVCPINDSINTKYDDLHFVMNIQQISEHITCVEEWKNPVLPSPIPNFDLKPLLKDSNYTCFYKSITKQRFNLVNLRTKVMERTKQFFINRNFLNIETPTLVPSGGAENYLNPFNTEYSDHRGNKFKLQLPTSPEFALKKILAEGISHAFQISRAYRNKGEVSQWHEPEFLMLEWYRVGASLKDILMDTQNFVLTLADFLGSHLDIPKHWPRFRVEELFQNILRLNLSLLQKKEDFYRAAKPLSISIVETDTWNDIFCKLFMEKIEPFLKEQKACFVTHYPLQMAALAAPEKIVCEQGNMKETYFAERAEAFLFGVEICNAYLELVDVNILQTRIEQTIKFQPETLRDPLFENAMGFGIPPCAGNALGLDRVIALLIGEKNISSLYAIPFLAQFLGNTVAKE